MPVPMELTFQWRETDSKQCQVVISAIKKKKEERGIKGVVGVGSIWNSLVSEGVT